MSGPPRRRVVQHLCLVPHSLFLNRARRGDTLTFRRAGTPWHAEACRVHHVTEVLAPLGLVFGLSFSLSRNGTRRGGAVAAALVLSCAYASCCAVALVSCIAALCARIVTVVSLSARARSGTFSLSRARNVPSSADAGERNMRRNMPAMCAARPPRSSVSARSIIVW